MSSSPSPFEQFAEAARIVSAELDLQHVVQAVTDAATRMTRAQFGAFFYNVIDQRGESYMLYTISGVPRSEFERFPMPRNTAVFAPTFSGARTVRSDDIRKDPRYGKNDPYYGMPKGHLPVVSYLAVPVTSRSGEVLGGLFFGHRDVAVFTENDERIVEAIAAQAAVAIDNARLYQELQRERARYKALVYAAPTPQALWLAHADGELLDELPGWRGITGQSMDEMRNGGWINALHPDDRLPTLRAWREAVETRSLFTRQYRLRMADGSYRWFAATGVPVLDEKGEPLEWVGTSIDVHDRKTSEDNLRFLARASDLLASSLDYETTLTTVAQLAVPEIADWCAVDIVDEQGTTRRLGVAHADPHKIELAVEFRRRFPQPPERDVITRVIQTGATDWMREIPFEMLERAAENDEHLAMMRELGLRSYIVVPLRTHDRVAGALTFVRSDSRFSESDVAFAEELARRGAVAIENARLYGEARAANRAKDDFLATLSHELRTPMTAVLGWSRMLQMGLSPEESRQAITAIEKSATVQMQLIEDILDLSRIMAGKMRIDHTPVDLREVTDAALATVRASADAKGIEVFVSAPPHLPPIAGDSARLQQIIWNLLANAIKFTPQGGTVMLRLAFNNDLVCVSVKDSGIGIDRDFLPHVFERFRQQDSSTTRAHGGIGVGLAIVRHLVEMHGGRITAESEGRGKGATFTVEFPALAARVHAQPQPETRTVADLPSLQGMNVLVIDDEVMTRDVVAAILRRCGAHVTSADSAREARAFLEQRVPDAIVCDLAMPGEDGFSFVRGVRERSLDVPVIALTAFGRSEDRERALQSGFDAYLKKPVDPAVLAATLHDFA